jgi:hypothetical protein
VVSYGPIQSVLGRGEIHPARSMHDTIGWALVYYILYETRVSADGLLAEHQIFNSIESKN